MMKSIYERNLIKERKEIIRRLNDDNIEDLIYIESLIRFQSDMRLLDRYLENRNLYSYEKIKDKFDEIFDKYKENEYIKLKYDSYLYYEDKEDNKESYDLYKKFIYDIIMNDDISLRYIF